MMVSQWFPKRALGAMAMCLLAFGILVAGRLFAGSPGGDPSSGSDRMVERLSTKLNLSDAQVQQVKQVFDSHREQTLAAFTAIGTARQALQSASEAASVDEAAIRTAAQALAKAEGDSALLHAQIHSQILPILNDEQKQKLSTLHDHEDGWKEHPHHSR